MGLIDRIDTICLHVSDVKRASEWYEEILGFQTSFNGDGYCVLDVGEGGIPLTLEKGDMQINGNQPFPIFFSEHIDQLYTFLAEKGVSVGELQSDGVNRFFDFLDSDGNRLQVCCWK
ncbi:VOC family protein [Oceanobacillus damuensis]|uniref:VOC family protein n=1 Tax=Oceanobacillus damuensis TaxID=937928 RepID=UPI00082B50F1|nr:VOC family protein [Oceanobacillus damuensis]